MKYRCLVLDHDDTVVNSTATIHYPAFREFMKTEKPEIRLTLEEYFLYNFEPGVISLFRDICGLSEKQMKQEEAFWRAYVRGHVPEVYEGLPEVLRRFQECGGILCVVSHSFSDYIRRDYRQNGLPEPDIVFGWDMEAEKRKPSPFALEEIMRRFHLQPGEILVLDDLKPGYDMAKAAGVDFAAAGWANDVPEIAAFMQENCGRYFKRVSDFGAFLEQSMTDQDA